MHEKYIRPGDGFSRLIEETGEVGTAIGDLTAALGKTLRFGPDSANPDLPLHQRETNAEWIERAVSKVQSEYADWLHAYAKYRQELTPAAASNDNEDYETWMKKGIALFKEYHGATGGLDLWIQWSEGARNFSRQACLQKWQSFI